MQSNSAKKHLPAQRLYIALAFFPVVMVVVWHFINQTYPRNDESYFFITSQDIFLKLKSDGLFNWLEALYLNRNWKPIFVSPAGSLFLILTGGNVLMAIKFAMIFYFSVFLIYLERFFREQVEGNPSLLKWAALGSVFLSTLPWVFSSSLNFNSEMPTLACVVAFYYHFWKCGGFKDKRHSLWMGFWLSLALCYRPVEAFLTLGILFFYSAVNAIRIKTVRKSEVLLFTALFLFDAGFVAFSVYQKQNPSLLICFCAWMATAVSVGAYYLFYAKKQTSHFFKTATFVFLFVEAWYFPYAYGLLQWAFMSSFGEWAHLSGVRVGLGPVKFVFHIFRNLGGLSFLVFAILAGLSFRQNEGQKEIAVWKNRLTMYLVAGVAPMLVGAFSNTHDLRYYFISFTGFYLFLFERLFRAKDTIKKTFVLVLAFFSLLQVGYISINSMNVTHWSKSLVNFGFAGDWSNSLLLMKQEELLPESYQVLKKNLNPSLVSAEKPVCILQMFKQKDLDWVHDPWALTLLSRQQGEGFIFERPWPFEQHDTESRLQSVRSKCSYVLIVPTGGTHHPPAFPMSQVAEFIMADPNYRGMQKVVEYPFTDRNRESGTAILFTTPKSNQ